MNALSTSSNDDPASLIKLAKVLTSPVRIAMLTWLSKNRLGMCKSFTRMLGISQPQVSKHLAVMKASDLVVKQRIGKTWVYELNQEKWKVIQRLNDVASS